jgi:hypothetical protein
MNEKMMSEDPRAFKLTDKGWRWVPERQRPASEHPAVAIARNSRQHRGLLAALRWALSYLCMTIDEDPDRIRESAQFADSGPMPWDCPDWTKAERENDFELKLPELVHVRSLLSNCDMSCPYLSAMFNRALYEFRLSHLPPIDDSQVPSGLLSFQRMVAQWGRETFPRQSTSGVMAHLEDEIQELKENPADPEELADCFLLLLQLASRAGVKEVDLLDAAKRKHEVNRDRKWGAPDERGVCRHVDDCLAE